MEKRLQIHETFKSAKPDRTLICSVRFVSFDDRHITLGSPLGITGWGDATKICWLSLIFNSVSCYQIRIHQTRFHACETLFPEMRSNPKTIRNQFHPPNRPDVEFNLCGYAGDAENLLDVCRRNCIVAIEAGSPPRLTPWALLPIGRGRSCDNLPARGEVTNRISRLEMRNVVGDVKREG